jgi:hypothetical protein
MDEAMFRHEVNDAVLFRDLHFYWKVICGLRWEEDIDSFLDERRVRSRVIKLIDTELSSQLSRMPRI